MNGEIHTDPLCYDRLHAHRHSDRRIFRQKIKGKLRKLLFRRTFARPVGRRYERGGVGHERLAAYGTSGRCLLVRYRGRGLDGYRPCGRHLHKLAVRIEKITRLFRSFGRFHYGSRLFKQPFS